MSRREFDVFPLGGHRSQDNLRDERARDRNPRSAYEERHTFPPGNLESETTAAI